MTWLIPLVCLVIPSKVFVISFAWFWFLLNVGFFGWPQVSVQCLWRSFVWKDQRFAFLWFCFSGDRFLLFSTYELSYLGFCGWCFIAEGVLVAASHPLITCGAAAALGLVVLKSEILCLLLVNYELDSCLGYLLISPLTVFINFPNCTVTTICPVTL